MRHRLGDRLHVLVSRVDLDARKIEFSLVKSVISERDGVRSRTLVLASDTGKPNKKAASKKSRPSSKSPKKSSGVNVNAAKAAGKQGAQQSKSAKASRGKSAAIRSPGKPSGSKPPTRKGKR